jgi:hypothetical protein
MRIRANSLTLATMLLTCCGAVGAAEQKTIQAGATWVVDGITSLGRLMIAPGAHITAPSGHDLTLTVNGVETNLRPGTYTGDVVITPAEDNLVEFSAGPVPVVHHFRQALYLDRTGIVAAKSVPSAAGKVRLRDGVLTGARIKSVGDYFNGIYVGDGSFTIKSPVIEFAGDGADDFAGYGAAVMSNGKGTTLVLDGAKIHTRGVVRTAIIAQGGSNLIVKSSEIRAQDGKLPADYVPNVDPGHMMSAPWMLGISGNIRATLLLGTRTRATYINSSISTENWAALSNDVSYKSMLTAIDSRVMVTGKNGYGAYSLGEATTSFYGSELRVRDYAVIVDAGGNRVVFGASTPRRVAELNSTLGLGLTPGELRSLPQKQTTVTSDRFGIMVTSDPVSPPWAAAAPVSSVRILDGTVFDTGQAVFLDKAVGANILVDGRKGARLTSRNGVILQVMDNDDPGPVMVRGEMLNRGVFREQSGAPVKVSGFDVGIAHESDVHATFTNISLTGDFYNGFRQGTSGWMERLRPSGKNLILAFEKARVTGRMTSAAARHPKDVITAADYELLGEVTDTPGAAINNGVIVSLAHSTWRVTGTSYLTRLTLDSASRIEAPEGSRLTMVVNGKSVPISAGAYVGDIVLKIGAGQTSGLP